MSAEFAAEDGEGSVGRCHHRRVSGGCAPLPVFPSCCCVFDVEAESQTDSVAAF